jgi:hypothetical protein
MKDGVCDKKDLALSPSVVLFQHFHLSSKPAKNEYRRNLLHLQVENKPQLSENLLQQNQKILDIQSGREIVN